VGLPGPFGTWRGWGGGLTASPDPATNTQSAKLATERRLLKRSRRASSVAQASGPVIVASHPAARLPRRGVNPLSHVARIIGPPLSGRESSALAQRTTPPVALL
jgi:hypothetical protein